MFFFSVTSGVLNRCAFGASVVSVTDVEADISTATFKLLQQLNAADSALCGCILWSIWKQWNNKFWDNTADEQSLVFSRTQGLIQDWTAVHEAPNTSGSVQ
ncbi:hypothetical protein L195_g014597 [Trifolium pratense]|uniref:Uncharacterized protein n=1 Tax=Trifolium pratense TaxID=57577 RepID=A0A2K3PRD3_TRIPR|nr:hypothetical protein L195_g038997 [Trifolium pratense]PNY17845.1 hypothetical protein L195_g014597 [Trifolium pratense]